MKKNYFYITKNHALKMRDFFIDLLFPLSCLSCGQEDTSFCNACREKIIINNSPSCPLCKKSNDEGAYCSSCKTDEYLDGLWISGDYHDRLLKTAVKNFKYHFDKSLAEALGQIMIKFLELNILNEDYSLGKDFIVVPVPLHWRRLRFRGFNQSQLLAGHLSTVLGLETAEVLKRIKNTKAQAKLSRTERLANLEGAFVCEKNPELKNKNIILIDDVCSTRSTLNNCAKVLKEAGAKEVWGFVLAKN